MTRSAILIFAGLVGCTGMLGAAWMAIVGLLGQANLNRDMADARRFLVLCGLGVICCLAVLFIPSH